MDFSFGEMCSVFAISASQSFSSWTWTIITTLWPWYWLLIILGLGTWVAIEIKTRNGTFHYNSKNGFSPTFNRFVGSGTYAGLQGLIYLFFKLVIGDIAYCMPWPYVLHLIVLLSTQNLLYSIGFWPEKRAGRQKKWYGKKKY